MIELEDAFKGNKCDSKIILVSYGLLRNKIASTKTAKLYFSLKLGLVGHSAFQDTADGQFIWLTESK